MTTDGLTCVYNKRFLQEALERELSRVRRRKSQLSVLMMDLDKFKTINDTHGHLAGDAVLVEFTQRATSCLAGDEILARFEGEEFALVVPDASVAEATQLAESIRMAVRSQPVCFEGTQIPITVSIGVAEFPGDESSTANTLLESADQMLYLKKRQDEAKFVLRELMNYDESSRWHSCSDFLPDVSVCLACRHLYSSDRF